MIYKEIIQSTLESIPELDKEEIVVPIVEDCFQKFGFTITQKTTLLTKPGSIHWHLKFKKEKGVLEATYWLPKNQLWLEIHSNRLQSWNEEMIEEMAIYLANLFNGKIGSDPNSSV